MEPSGSASAGCGTASAGRGCPAFFAAPAFTSPSSSGGGKLRRPFRAAAARDPPLRSARARPPTAFRSRGTLRALSALGAAFLVGGFLAGGASAADPKSVQNEAGPLVSLTQFRQQHRFTVGGKLCAAAFVHDYQTYTDCTATASPDGSVGREWCYVIEQLQEGAAAAGAAAGAGGGSAAVQVPNWGYCAPTVDYNVVRAKANDAFAAKISEGDKIISRLDGERAKLEDLLRRYNETCGVSQEAISARIGSVERLLAKAELCLGKIGQARGRAAELQRATAALEEQIARERAAALGAPENCAAVRGYDDDPFPDGLRGSYFANPVFFGETPAATRVDDTVDFRWSQQSPADGVPYHSFSVRWEGFLNPPFTGEYEFFTEADCGARLYVNQQLVLVDRMPAAPYAVQPGPVPLLPPAAVDGVQRVGSVKVQLRGGDPAALRLEMVHSGHLRWRAAEEAEIRLLWAHPGLAEPEIVPADRLYRSNRRPALKLSRVDPAAYEISYFQDGEFAFLGSNAHFLADVPLRFEGAKMIRGAQSPGTAELAFEVNIPAVLHVGVPAELAAGGGAPLTSACVKPFAPAPEGHDYFSVYESAGGRDVPAESAAYFRIFTSEITRPGKLVKVTALQAGMPLFAFFTPLKTAALTACGGPVEPVSRPSGDILLACAASSRASAETADCQHALSGRMLDQPYFMWRSASGNGVGEFLELRFRQPVLVTGFRLKLPDAPTMWPAQLGLSTVEGRNSGDPEQLFSVVHAGNLDDLVYDLDPPEMTKYLRLTVTQMYAFGDDVGLAVDVLGSRCVAAGGGGSGGGAGGEAAAPPPLLPQFAQLARTSPAPPLPPADPNSAAPNSAAPDLPETILVDDCDAGLDQLEGAQPLEPARRFRVACPPECTSAAAAAAHPVFGGGGPEAPAQAGAAVADGGASGGASGDAPPFSDPAASYALESAVCAAAVHAGACPADGGSECLAVVTLRPGARRFAGGAAHGVVARPHGPADLSFALAAAGEEEAAPAAPSEVALTVRFDAGGSGDAAAAAGGGDLHSLLDSGAANAVSAQSPDFAFGWSDRRAGPCASGAGVAFPLSPRSELCAGGASDLCGRSIWRMKLPPRRWYTVEAQVGRACEGGGGAAGAAGGCAGAGGSGASRSGAGGGGAAAASAPAPAWVHNVQANGVPLVQSAKLSGSRSYWGLGTVYAGADGLLTVTADCAADCDRAMTVLQSLSVKSVPPEPRHEVM